MKLYLAAPFEELARLKVIRQRVETETTHSVVSSWLNESPTKGPILPTSEWLTLALRDLREIKASNILLVDTFATNDRGGAQVEYGFAMGYQKQVWLVGPVRNVFHTLAQRQFANWDQVIEELKHWVAPLTTIRPSYDSDNTQHWSDEWRKSHGQTD